MTGDEIREARERLGLTQQQLGQAIGVTMRTIGNWERGATVPQRRMGALRQVLADGRVDPESPGIRSASDAELLAEIARRFARTTRQDPHHAAPMNQAPESGATVTDFPSRTQEVNYDEEPTAAREGVPDLAPDTTTGEESQVPPEGEGEGA